MQNLIHKFFGLNTIYGVKNLCLGFVKNTELMYVEKKIFQIECLFQFLLQLSTRQINLHFL